MIYSQVSKTYKMWLLIKDEVQNEEVEYRTYLLYILQVAVPSNMLTHPVGKKDKNGHRGENYK